MLAVVKGVLLYAVEERELGVCFWGGSDSVKGMGGVEEEDGRVEG